MPNYIIYLLFALLLFGIELLYFRIADHYNIIDHPNERSSHSEITLLGGGIIFPVAIIMYAAFSGLKSPYFVSGLFIISLISFWDDINNASSRLRLLFHVIAVSLLFQDLGLFSYPAWIVACSYIVVIGTINAYNFMDGINGITGLYSLSVITTLLYINNTLHFVEQDLLLITILALFVFLFFNFRTNARCFAGDVGSVSIAFIVLFSLASLIIFSREFLYILFLAVYGVDSVLTILFRLFNRENIFKPHRSHVYQLLSNEKGISHLRVALFYSIIQFVTNLVVIYTIKVKLTMQGETILSFSILLILSLLYLRVRTYSRSATKYP